MIQIGIQASRLSSALGLLLQAYKGSEKSDIIDSPISESCSQSALE